MIRLPKNVEMLIQNNKNNNKLGVEDQACDSRHVDVSRRIRV
jgi:hypothetical protein